MPNPIIKIVNQETGQEVERPMTSAEFAEYQEFQAEAVAQKEAEQNKKASKEALLERLGITEAEAKLLLA